MKKLMLGLLLIGGFLFSKESAAQTKIKYYYYPNENVYMNTTTHQYGYISGSDWTWGNLPGTIVVADTNRYVVLYSPNDQIWKQNNMHKMKYKDGRLKKIKTKDDDK